MPSGSRNNGSDGYVFVDGRAVRIDAGDTAVPGQGRAGARGGRRRRDRRAGAAGEPAGQARRALHDMEQSDAFELRADAAEGIGLAVAPSELRSGERREMRRKYALFGGILIVVVAASLCISEGFYLRFYTPVEVVYSLATQARLFFIGLFDPAALAQARADALAAWPMYADVFAQALHVLKWIVAGSLLALSGMLYQNAFRNPIAAPSMLGVSNGMNLATLILVLQFGYEATNMVGRYFVYSYAGGIAILLLVMLGGKWVSGKGRFNTVNMILMGTVVSQLIGVVLTFAQSYMSDSSWDAYYLLTTATSFEGPWTYASLAIGLLVSIVPIFVFRFRLNLVSFEDGETRLLGVNPNKLRLLALGCGSVMILTAQVNVGQVAMASLVVPFVARAVFGAEFRKQLWGNVLIGALLILVCGDLCSLIHVENVPVDLGSLVTIFAMPLFIWMLAIRQRSWD